MRQPFPDAAIGQPRTEPDIPMRQSNAVVELDALLMKCDPDSMDWAGYACEDGEELLSRLNAEDRAVLFGALGDVGDNVGGEALRRLYFYCGFIGSATKGVFEDRRLRIDSFWDRVRLDPRVVQRIEQLSLENRYLSAYWGAFSEAAGKGGNAISP